MDIEDEPKAGAPEWMVTFADLMSLLLTFFVLLLSFSNLEIVKFRTMAGAVKNALGLKSEFDLNDMPAGKEMLPYEDQREGQGEAAGDVGAEAAAEKSAEQIERDLQEFLEEAGLATQGATEIVDDGVILRLSGDLFFASGSAALSPSSHGALNGIAEQLLETSRYLDVVGHTDNIPIATAVYPSNWELSAARAGSAVRYLVAQGVPPVRVRAIGSADTEPLADNANAEGRSQNRRVEFIFAEIDDAEPEPAPTIVADAAPPQQTLTATATGGTRE